MIMFTIIRSITVCIIIVPFRYANNTFGCRHHLTTKDTLDNVESMLGQSNDNVST